MNRQERALFCDKHPEMFQYHRYGEVPDAIQERPDDMDFDTFRSTRKMANMMRKRLLKMGARSRLVKKIVARTDKEGNTILVNKGVGTLRYSDYA